MHGQKNVKRKINTKIIETATIKKKEMKLPANEIKKL